MPWNRVQESQRGLRSVQRRESLKSTRDRGGDSGIKWTGAPLQGGMKDASSRESTSVEGKTDRSELNCSRPFSWLRPTPSHHLRSLAFLSPPLVLPALYDSGPSTLSVQSFPVSQFWQDSSTVSGLPVSRENNLLVNYEIKLNPTQP